MKNRCDFVQMLLMMVFMLFPLMAHAQSNKGDQRSPVLFIAGQSREEFRDYLRDVSKKGQQCPLPAGASFYTALNSSGFTEPHANFPGDNHQDLEYLQMVQNPLVIQIGLWMSREQLYQTIAGDQDAQIKQMFESLKALQRPVLLRIGYEFDGPHNRYPPAAYVQAYQRIAKVMRGARDIMLVWHSYAMIPTYQNYLVTDWYPGDEYVDWIGISVFQIGDEGFHETPNRDKLLAFARAKGKPVVIGEASAIRYTHRQKKLTGKEYWDYWYKPYFELIEQHPEIRATTMIHVDWDNQQQHRELDWGDCRIDRDPYVLKQWRRQLEKPYWLSADKSLYSQVRGFVKKVDK